MVVRKGVVMEEVYENLIIADESTGDKGIRKIIISHGIIIKAKYIIKANFIIIDLLLSSRFFAKRP